MLMAKSGQAAVLHVIPCRSPRRSKRKAQPVRPGQRRMTFPSQHHVRFLERMAPVRHDNEIVVVLTGHLLIEELLVASVEKNIPKPTS